MSELLSKPDHGDKIVVEGRASARLQIFFDDIQQRMNDFLLGRTGLQLRVYAKASLPTPSDVTQRYMIFVSDASGFPEPAFWNGSTWRRGSDGTLIS